MLMKLSRGQASFGGVLSLAVLLAGATSAFATAERQASRGQVPGSALKPGVKLTYGSGGREQAPWTIDSVHRDVAWGGRTDCARIFLRMRPDQLPGSGRVFCRGGDTLFAWNATTNEWRAERPLGAGMTLRVPQPSGAALHYTTAELGDTTISGHRFEFVRTTIITHDPQDRPIRRLRERYAVALATALGGVFEVPDSVTAGAWREVQRFDLVRVEIP